jgi:hypothetical protein
MPICLEPGPGSVYRSNESVKLFGTERQLKRDNAVRIAGGRRQDPPGQRLAVVLDQQVEIEVVHAAPELLGDRFPWLSRDRL